MSKKQNKISDIKAAGLLAKDGVAGVVDIVEGIHYNILRLGGILGKSKNRRTKGIAGLVYKNIRAITDISGESFEVLMGKLAQIGREIDGSEKREAVIAAINGVIGDHLVERNNSLAIHMQLRYDRAPITMVEQLRKVSGEKYVLLVHGSCMNDLQWNRRGHDHGKKLSEDLGYTPLYLVYNSGRHISANGKELAEILEVFMKHASDQIEFTMLAHSMGGLVARSAIHFGMKQDHAWVKRFNKLIFLGTPHHGAPLEKGGNWIDNMLDANPFTAPLSRLGKIRSAGITDLRYGNVLDEDWNKHDRFASSGDPRTPVPLPIHVECYTIAANLGIASSKLNTELIGDGLVPVSSALGKHKNPRFALLFPRENQWVGQKMDHLDLLSHPDVYTKIKSWMNNEQTDNVI